MCGIAGLTSPSTNDDAWASVLARMTNAIEHRGPDGHGSYVTHSDNVSTVALGHVRLAIIDPDSGSQPMSLDADDLVVVFNGEIYNYVELRAELRSVGHDFDTDSDTEVLLRAWQQWGAGCLPRLRGMFAFAVWDTTNQTLHLARDAFGKKPLFYSQCGREFLFASELASLVEHPDFDGHVNQQALAHYMLWKYVPGNQTLVDSVNEIPPGHYATWDGTALCVSRYYEVPDLAAPAAQLRGLDGGTVADFRAELEEAVKIRLRSDVPLGAFLSGGLDSSAIVALMSQITGSPVKTFAVGFDDQEYSELWAARLIAERYNTDHHEITIGPQDFLDQLEAVTWQRGAPLSEMADVPLYSLSKLASEHVKVVLSGEGADELLGGYPKHDGDNKLARAHKIVPAYLDGAIGAAGRHLPYKYRRLAILARVAQNRDFVDRQAAWFGLLNTNDAAALCPDLFRSYKPFVWPDDPGEDTNNLIRALKFDKTVWLPGTLLERGDRMTMAAGLEGRMPFMDTQLAEFVSGLSPHAMIDERRGKAILRHAMANDLPAEILARPKAGFRVPVHEWLRGTLKDYAHERLFGSQSQLTEFTDTVALRRIWNEHQSKRSNREKELWSLMCLDIFLRQLSERSGVGAAA